MVKSPEVLTNYVFQNDRGIFDVMAENYNIASEIIFVIDYIKKNPPNQFMHKNLRVFLSWLSYQKTSLRFEHEMHKDIEESYLATYWQANNQTWLINAFRNENYNQILQFEFSVPNKFLVNYLSGQTRTKIDQTIFVEMDASLSHKPNFDRNHLYDPRNDNFYKSLRASQSVNIDCSKVIHTDKISITFEIVEENKILRVISFDKCIHSNHLDVLKLKVGI